MPSSLVFRYGRRPSLPKQYNEYHGANDGLAWRNGACSFPFGPAAMALASEPSGKAGKAVGRIIFSSNRSGPWRIWSVRPDGTDLREITKAQQEEHDVDPVFSPDGAEILFSSTRGGATGVWRMTAGGTKATRICEWRSGGMVA